MERKLLLCLLLLIVTLTNAQRIYVYDSETDNPVEMAIIKSTSSRSTFFTDAHGHVDMSAFKGSDKILISHLSYHDLFVSYSQLDSLNFRVGMHRKSADLSEVTVTANDWELPKIETPSRITKINMKEVAFQNPQTTADLLGASGYAFIQKSQLGGGSPMLRGMATNRVLLVIDGVRMNNAIFRSGNLQNVISLDVNALENSEIIFGPGSVMYGSDAIGGVMSFVTLTPQCSGLQINKPIVTGNAMTRLSSANSEITGHVDFNVGFKKWAFLSSITYADYGDLRSGSVGGDPYFYRTNYVITYGNKDYMIPNQDSTLQLGSKYNQINFMQKVRFQPTSYLDIDYSFHISETSKFNRYDRLYVMRKDGPYKDKLRWAEWYYGPQKWQMHRLGVNYTRPSLLFDNFSFVAAGQMFEESRYDREFMYRELRMQKENVNALSFNLDFEKKVDEKLSVNYGAEYVHNNVYSVASLTHVVTKAVNGTVTRYPDGSTWQSRALYLTSKYKLTDKFLLTGGLRYNQFIIKAVFDTTFFPFPFTKTKMNSSACSGSLGFVYDISRSWQLYFNAASAFRAPNIDDMGKVFESVPGYLVVPNPGLKPEKVYNLELGTVKKIGSYLTIDATVYHTWLVDAMVRKNFVFNGDTTIRYLGNKSRIQAIQNVAQIRVYGIQAGIELNYQGFGLKSNISYQNGKEQTPDSLVYYPLRHAAPTFGSTHLTYEYRRKFKADFYVVYNAKMDYDDLALTERTNASYARDEEGRAFVLGWYTLNFKLSYSPNPLISLMAGIENITDLLYRPYSSGINAPGRNLISSLRVKF